MKLFRQLVGGACLLIAAQGSSFAQSGKQDSKSGNVVAYFGEDKKEEIHEGTVVHQFNSILYAGTDESYGRSITPTDQLAYKLFHNKLAQPSKGEVAGTDHEGNTVRWELATANEDGVIQSRDYLSGHLYANYSAVSEKVMLLEVAGPTMTFINGMPHEGDHYNYGYTITPFQMNKGNNSFLFTPGRFGMLKARLVEPTQPVLITKRDLLLPDLIIEENNKKWGAIRVINTSNKTLKGYSVETQVGTSAPVRNAMATISPIAVRKVPFVVADDASVAEEQMPIRISILDSRGKIVDELNTTLHARTKYKHHERTFVSTFDGSIQYYSVAPSLNRDDKNQAMFLSVHGASVQARNQARAYGQKDWGHLVAPTNRRPHGFAWEDWGRLDAMEVLADGEKLFKTDKAHTYLTGHSMGGHGSWYLGATYPDRFAAIAPCAGYPELLGYAVSGEGEETVIPVGQEAINSIFERATNVSRTKKLARNYLQSGVYIVHGDSDNVVPTAQAQAMRNLLGDFQKDMAYYEHPGGKHWYGNESVDFKPIFDYFKWHSNPSNDKADHFEFYTANPGVNAKSQWITVEQQVVPFEISSVDVDVYDRKEGARIITATHNIRTLSFDLASAALLNAKSITIDGQEVVSTGAEVLLLQKQGKNWTVVESVDAQEKNPVRSGGFKTAFTNRPVFVYASRGRKKENAWYYNKARFDAETFYYRGNSSIELVRDVDFKASNYANRNVILYGNADNNTAWSKVLDTDEFKVTKSAVILGNRTIKGDNLGVYCVRPRKGSATASVGIVAGTGIDGMFSVYQNQYFVAGHGFPDLIVVDDHFVTDGVEGVVGAGYFGNDWTTANGEFGWR